MKPTNVTMYKSGFPTEVANHLPGHPCLGLLHMGCSMEGLGFSRDLSYGMSCKPFTGGTWVTKVVKEWGGLLSPAQ
jgi:hypothetical protein